MTETYLAHHGIKGQKWGVRRFQNYDGTRINKGKSELRIRREAALTSNYESMGLTKEQAEKMANRRATVEKALMIAGGVAITAAAAYGAYKLAGVVKNGRFPDNREIDILTGLPKMSALENEADSLASVNPGRIRWGLSKNKNLEIMNGSSQNCMLCTTAYELRRRGYDVTAGFSKEGYEADTFFYKVFEKPKKVEHLNYNDLIDNLGKEGPNARGNIVVYWLIGGGHSMIWENDSTGKTVFKDGQTGQVYKDFAKQILFSTDPNSYIETVRTDNLQLKKNIPSEFLNTDLSTKQYLDHMPAVIAKTSTRFLSDVALAGGGTALVLNEVDKKQTEKMAKQNRRANVNNGR